MTTPSLESRSGLLQQLDVIAERGWQAPAGQCLLAHVRVHIVRPLVRGSGLRGPAAEQAESTGWAVAWETLNSPSTRTATSPWGVLWVAVRRAVAGERLSAQYQASARNSWRAQAVRPEQPAAGPVSLSLLLENGWEPAAEIAAAVPLGRRLDLVVDALVGVGWERRAAHAVVEGVALTATRHGKATRAAQGWRPLAAHLDLPPWQVRRVTVLLLGAPGWPGVVERLVAGGRQVLQDDSIRTAVRSTAFRSFPPPAGTSRSVARPAPAAC